MNVSAAATVMRSAHRRPYDSERIPVEVEANVAKTRQLLQHFDTPAEQRGLLERMVRYFTKERKVAEQSIEEVKKLIAQTD